MTGGNLSINTDSGGNKYIYVLDTPRTGEIIGVNIKGKQALTFNFRTTGQYLYVQIKKNGAVLSTTGFPDIGITSTVTIDISQYQNQGNVEIGIFMAESGSANRGYIYGIYLT